MHPSGMVPGKRKEHHIMRYQVPVTVTLTAYSPDEARATVQRLVNLAPQAGVRLGDTQFTVGAAVQQAEPVRTNRTALLSDDEFAAAQEAVARVREGRN